MQTDEHEHMAQHNIRIKPPQRKELFKKAMPNVWLGGKGDSK